MGFPNFHQRFGAILSAPIQSNVPAATSAGSFVVPAGRMISSIVIVNSTANAVTGGIKFGTTAGGVDVAAAVAVGANAVLAVLDAALLKRFFSASVDTTIYYDAVVGWNSANVRIAVSLALV